MAKCEHKTARLQWTFDGRPSCFRCVDCDAIGIRPLGPSNDEPVEVRVEMLAADTYARGYDDAPPFSDANFMSLFGFANHMKQLDKSAMWPPDDSGGRAWWAGWLLAEMSTHDGRETRDASAWPWDPTRPIAGQQPGNASCPRHPTANRNADGDCIECARERTEEAQAEEDRIRRGAPADVFTCSSCRKVKPNSVGEDDMCDDCWFDANRTAVTRRKSIDMPDHFDDEAFDVSDVLPNSEQR